MLSHLAIRYAFTVGISVTALMISLALDVIFAPLPPVAQFIVQIPILVLIVDAFRHWCLVRAAELGLSDADINASFFFAAPMAALGAGSLFSDIRGLIQRRLR